MKPILTVEGKEFEVYAVYYRDSKVHSVTIMDENNVARQYHDINENTQYYIEKPLQIDFSEALKWKGQYKPVIELINKRIEAHEELLAEYETELMQEYRANLKARFASDKMRDLAEKHAIMSNVVDGLHEALGIAVQDVHMVEDVDLSGGEE